MSKKITEAAYLDYKKEADSSVSSLRSMFCLNDMMRYFLCADKSDRRKGLHSLCGVVHDFMGYDVLHGDAFIFVNGAKNTIKNLHAEHGGLVLCMKKLEQGAFRPPRYNNESKSY